MMEQIKAWVKTQTLTHSLADLAGQVADKAKELVDINRQITDKASEMEFKTQTLHHKMETLEDALRDKRTELRDTKRQGEADLKALQGQIEAAQVQLAEFLNEVEYISEDRPDRITERRDIGKLLYDKGIAVPDIAAYFKVSPKTIERDLNGHMQKAN